MKNFKTTMMAAIMFMPLVSRSQNSTVTLEFANATPSLEVVQNYVKALGDGDPARMNAFLSGDAMVYGLGGALDSLNKQQHMEYYAARTAEYKYTFTNELYLPVKVTNNWNEGEWVLSWGVATLSDKKSAVVIQVPYHTAALLENGKIKNLRYWYDNLNIAQSQGMKLVPAGN